MNDLDYLYLAVHRCKFKYKHSPEIDLAREMSSNIKKITLRKNMIAASVMMGYDINKVPYVDRLICIAAIINGQYVSEKYLDRGLLMLTTFGIHHYSYHLYDTPALKLRAIKKFIITDRFIIGRMPLDIRIVAVKFRNDLIEKINFSDDQIITLLKNGYYDKKHFASYLSDKWINFLLSLNGMLIENIIKPTNEQIEIALKQNGFAIKFIQNSEFYEKAIRTTPKAIIYIHSPTTELYLSALSRDSTIIINIPFEKQTKEMCELVLHNKFLRNYIRYHPCPYIHYIWKRKKQTSDLRYFYDGLKYIAKKEWNKDITFQFTEN